MHVQLGQSVSGGVEDNGGGLFCVVSETDRESDGFSIHSQIMLPQIEKERETYKSSLFLFMQTLMIRNFVLVAVGFTAKSLIMGVCL